MKIPWIQVEPDEETKKMLEAINVKLNKLIFKQQVEILMEESQMASAQEMLAKVEEQTTIVGSVVTAIAELRADLANNPAIPPEVQAAIDDSFAKLTTNSDALAAAIVTGTPAE